MNKRNLPNPSDKYNSDFVVGDVVAFNNQHNIDRLVTITALQPENYFWLDDENLAHMTDIRHATTQELKARKRLDQPVALFVPDFDDIEKHHQRAIEAQGEVS